MLTIAVVEDKTGKLSDAISKTLGNRARVTRLQSGTGYFDVVVWSDNCQNCKPVLETRILITFKCMIAPNCKADIAISCGLSDRDTVTFSSSLEGGMAALQREIVTLSGKVVEPREIPLSHIFGNMDEKLAIATLMLVMD